MALNSELIEQILDKRLGRGIYEGKGRLQNINGKIAALRKVSDKVEALSSLIVAIRKELKTESGNYFKFLSSDPEALSKFYDVSCKDAQIKLKLLMEELERLKSRFSRKALRIAFIGVERQGKSTFLKTITGLNDRVIPAYSGNSCTGAVSVIHYSDEPLKVDVEYFSEQEFLDTVKIKLEKYFPNNKFYIGKLADVKNLSLPECLGENATLTENTEYHKFKTSYIEHYDDYCDLVGIGLKSYYDEAIIAQHVAQYEEFPNKVEGSKEKEKNNGSIVWEKRYFKYVAVKNVDIYTPFKIADTSLLELVDTIGIGGAADSVLIEKEMYRVLREDCDAAIDLFRPEKTGDYPRKQTDLLDNIWKKLSDRDPSKWIVYVINKATHGEFLNVASVADVMPVIQNALAVKSTKKPVAWAKDIVGDDLDEVTNLLINPLLDLITSNLDTLDDNLMNDVDNLAKETYSQCLSLVKAASDVTSASLSMSGDVLSLFDETLFKDLLKDFGYALNQLDELGYAKKKDQKCKELENEYKRVLDNIDEYLPNESDIHERFITGAILSQSQVFEEYVEQMRNDIFASFENVNATVLIPLQEKVKSELAAVLYEQGKLKCLPLKSSENGPSMEWLQELLDNYIDENVYPYLNKAIQFILNYQINIEGMVEYNVARALSVIDKTNREFIPYKGAFTDNFEEKASEVWQELCNRLMPVVNRMKSWIGDFTLIPSHSFYSRVHKFHIKLMTDQGGVKDFRRFYRNNMGQIWNNEILNIHQTEKAFGDWTSRVNDLKAVVTNDNFKMN